MYQATHTLDIIATGTGRCGTGFVSKLLDSVGIKCGHETVFSTGGFDQSEINLLYRTDLQADSSWLAAPFLDTRAIDDAFVIHLVRHPKKMIESAIKIRKAGLDGHGRYDAFARIHCQGLADWDNLESMIAYRYIHWNKMIEDQLPGRQWYRHKIEREPFELLDALLEAGEIRDYRGKELFDNRKYNSKTSRHQVSISLDDIDPSLHEALLEISARYGYDWDREP